MAAQCEELHEAPPDLGLPGSMATWVWLGPGWDRPLLYLKHNRLKKKIEKKIRTLLLVYKNKEITLGLKNLKTMSEN